MRKALSLLAAFLLSAHAYAQPPAPVGGDMSNTSVKATGSSTPRTLADRFATPINVRDFGAKGDCSTDDWWSFQQAIFAAFAQPKGNTVLVPPVPNGSCYRISQALRLQSNVHVVVQSPATRIHCTGDATGTDQTGAVGTGVFPLYACSVYGSGNTLNLVGMPSYAGGSVTKGATSVTLTTPTDTANLVVGDLVLVRSPASQDYNEGGRAMPRWGALVQLAAINTGSGLLTLDRPVTPDTSYATTLVVKLTNGAHTAGWPDMINANSQHTNIPNWATINAGIEGGFWDAGNTLPFQAGGAALDCIETPDQVIASFGAGYSNLFQSCAISVQRELVSREAWELSYLSAYNKLDIGAVQANGAQTNLTAPGQLVAIAEGSYGNSVRVASIANYAGDSVPFFTLGGTIAGGGGDLLTANITLSTAPGVPVAVTYTTVGGDTLLTAATAFAAAINANATVSGAGITAFTNPGPYPGTVLFNRTGPVMFNVKATGGGSVSIAGLLTDLLNISASYNNSVTLDSVDGDAVTGDIVHLQQGFSGATQPPTSGNAVQIGVVPMLFADRYVKVESAGTSNNVVQAAPGGGMFTGNVFTAGGAFQIAANAGPSNRLSGLSGYGSIATTSCLVSDPTAQLGNRFDNVFTTLGEPDNLNSLQIINITNCHRRGGSDASMRQLRGYVAGIWTPGTVTNAAAVSRTYAYPANSIEIYYTITAHLTARMGGTAAAKTGRFAFHGCSATFSIPADATYGDVWFKAEVTTPTIYNCWTNTTSDSVATPGSRMTVPAQGSASIAIGGNFNWTIDATTGTDSVIVKSLAAWADSPLFDSNVPW